MCSEAGRQGCGVHRVRPPGDRLAGAKARGKSGARMLGAKTQKARLSDQAFAEKYGLEFYMAPFTGCFFACILCHSLHWPENRAPFLSDPCGAVSFVSGALEQKHGINRSLPPLFCCTYLSIISSAFQVLDRISHRTNDILRHTSRQTVPLPQSNADRKGERASRPLWQKLSGFSPLLARTT